MKPFMSGSLIAALVFGGARYAVCSPDGGEQTLGQPTSVTLTNDRPTGSFSIDPETLMGAPPILVMRVTKVVNPGRTAFQIFVYLSYQSGAGRTEQEKILIGNLGLYPSDRPAGFLLRASNAFAKLKVASSTSTDVRVLVEMKRLHKANPWTAVEVTVAPPEWKTEPSN